MPSVPRRATGGESIRLVHTYEYTDQDGNYIFEKRRFEPKTFLLHDKTARNSIMAKRPKAHLIVSGWWEKALYVGGGTLKDLVDQPGRSYHLVEGEKDADALASIGLIAASGHEGSCKFHRLQAHWLAGASSIYIWLDKDYLKDDGNPAVPCRDAVIKHNLLVKEGVDARQIFFVKAKGRFKNKDAADHVAAGYGIEDMVPVNKQKVLEVARGYTPEARRRLGY